MVATIIITKLTGSAKMERRGGRNMETIAYSLRCKNIRD